MRGDIAITTSTAGAVATLRGPTGRCLSTVGVSRQFRSSTVASIVSWTATCSFVVFGLASSDGGHLSNYVVNSHEVGILRELGDDFSRAHPLSLTCYRGDRHKALLWGVVHPILDLVESLCEIPDG
jgi:hypothetical protein